MTCHHAPIGDHQEIPEDESHCDCMDGFTRDSFGEWMVCQCDCHGPAWTRDIEMPPDFFPDEL